ncbi:ATP-binding domain-containing protein [Arthrobacter sp. 754]|uniref:HelD family protein n=1 Tax=Arthrobacter sp. 754 TaxID=3156315 RepID=UPI0033972E16
MTAQLQDTDREAFEAEKAVEQGFFDDTKLVYDKHLEDAAKAVVSGNTHERSAQRAALQNRKRLEPTEAVATARMDLDNGETIYLGSIAIRDHDYELLVCPWQSEIGSSFYAATPEDPHGVSRKRVFATTYNRIDTFTDQIFQELSDEFKAETFVGLDPLLEDLGRDRGEFMADIVRTITADQNRIIRAPREQLLVIQGGPGTGKTAVALHRVSWILFNFAEELQPKDVLVVGPNPTFTKYIKRVLPTLGDVDVVQQSLAQLLAGNLAPRGQESNEIARKKGSAKMESIVHKGLKDRERIPVNGLSVRRSDSTIRTLQITSFEIKDALERLSSSKHNRRRAQLKTALQAVLLSKNFAGRLDPLALIDQESFEEQVDRVLPRLSPQQFVRDLYGSKERLVHAGATAAEAELLYRRPAAKTGEEAWTMADLGVIDCATDSINGTPLKYGHIVVDEAQDLSYLQLRAVRRRSQNGSMTVVGDIAQATSAYARKDWNQVLTTLGDEDNYTETELTVGYRVPAPALAVAAKVLETAAPGLAPPKAFPRPIEEEPQWHVAEEIEMMDSVVRAVMAHSSRGLFVGVVVPPTQMNSVQGAFKAAGMKFSESATGGLSQGINLISPEEAKGLEFDAVVVVEPKAILHMAQGAKLLYIALTRTVHHLDVVLRSDRIPAMLGEFISNTVPQESAVVEKADDKDVDDEGPEIQFPDTFDDGTTNVNEDHWPGEVSPESEDQDDSDGGSDEGSSVPQDNDSQARESDAETDVTPAGSSSGLKPMLERMAQGIASDFFDVLREVSPSVQQRVVDVLWDKIEEATPDV